MKLHQLSLFLENRRGALQRPCRVLADAGIDILALTLADTAEFGILRMIVKDHARAREVLERAGLVVNVTEVLAIEAPQRPGGLLEVLELLDGEPGCGVEYMYAFTEGVGGKRAALVFRFEDPDQAAAGLARHGVNVVAPAELFDRMDA